MVWRSSVNWQRPETVNEHIRRLRNKLEVDPANPTLLVTVRGVGYRFASSRPLTPQLRAPMIDLRSDERESASA